MSYAVIELSGSQFLVTEGTRLKVNRVGKNPGESWSLTPLLLISETDGVLVGRPEVAGAKVELALSENTRDRKIEILHFHSKSRYVKHRGHRQPISWVEVTAISTPSGQRTAAPVAKKSRSEAADAATDTLEILELSTRTRNVLIKAGVSSAAALAKLSREELLELPGVGEKAAEEILAALK